MWPPHLAIVLCMIEMHKPESLHEPCSLRMLCLTVTSWRAWVSVRVCTRVCVHGCTCVGREKPSPRSLVAGPSVIPSQVIANAVQHYGIKPEGGMSGRCSHGENKLDELAADVLLNALNFSQKVGVVVLDKHEKPYEYDSEGGPPRKYAVVSDALDGYVLPHNPLLRHTR